jgi:hypothetical protein
MLAQKRASQLGIAQYVLEKAIVNVSELIRHRPGPLALLTALRFYEYVWKRIPTQMAANVIARICPKPLITQDRAARGFTCEPRYITAP